MKQEEEIMGLDMETLSGVSAEQLERLQNLSTEDLTRWSRVDPDNLVSETMARHGSLYFYVADKYYREARPEKAKAKREVERVRAQVFTDIQAEDPSLAIGKTERLVEINEKVQEAEEALHRARQREGRLRGLLEAMDHRRDMIVQIAARQRSELEAY